MNRINRHWKIDNISWVFYSRKALPTEHDSMSVLYRQAEKQKYRITLELDVQGDFDPHQINWEDIFELEGGEQCEAYIEDLSNPIRW